MIKISSRFQFTFRFSRKYENRRAGWSDTSIDFGSINTFIQKRHYPVDAPIHNFGISLGDKYQEVGEIKYRVRSYIFLKQVEYYNDKPVKRYDWELRKDVEDWEWCGQPAKEPTDHCRMKLVIYYLPFLKIETTYLTEYDMEKEKEFVGWLTKDCDGDKLPQQ